MHLNDKDQARWNEMTADAHLLERKDPHMKLKTEFRMSDPEIKTWMQDVLAPSLMDGEAGVALCMASVEKEQDTVLRALKVNLIEHWWNIFGTKTPEDVVSQFKNNGMEKDTLRHMVLDNHFPPEPNMDQIENIRLALAEEHGLDPEDIVVEMDGMDVPTYH